MFKLTEEEEKASLNMYGKIIRCVVAPYHDYVNNQYELSEMIGRERLSTTYVFPERDLTIQQRKGLINTFVNSRLTEINFVTADVFIILDMIDTSCRLFTPDNTLVNVPIKTFGANQHTIIYELLQNKEYDKIYANNKSFQKEKINDLIEKINNAKYSGLTSEIKDSLEKEIRSIGEPVISNQLLQMLFSTTILGQ